MVRIRLEPKTREEKTLVMREYAKGPLYTAVGRRLKLLRQRQELEQFEAAQRVGIDATYLCKLEQGWRLPNRNAIVRLAILYGVKPHQLFFGKARFETGTASSDRDELFPLESITASA